MPLQYCIVFGSQFGGKAFRMYNLFGQDNIPIGGGPKFMPIVSAPQFQVQC